MSYKSILWLLVSFVWLKLFFINGATKAHAYPKINNLSSQQGKVLPQNSTAKSNSYSSSKIISKTNPFQTQAKSIEKSSSNFGSPSLHLSPNQGERKFEPTRIPLVIPVQKSYRSSPSITIINPSGYGAAWGNVGVGVGLQGRTRFRDQSDGVIGIGFGLGNPQKNVGLQLGVTLVDVSDPFRDGTLNLKLHRRLPYNSSIALGIQGAVSWGDPDGGSSVYGAISKRIPLKKDRSKPFSEIYTSLGIGGGQFRSEFNIDNKIESTGVFGSLAVRTIEPMNVIAEWTGQDLTLGVSIVPFRDLPLVIVPGVTDITGQAGDGARFILGVGYSLSF